MCVCVRGWGGRWLLHSEFFGQRLGIYFTVIDGLFFVFQGINTSHVIPWNKEMKSVFVWLIKSFKNPFILGYIAEIFRKQFTKSFIPHPSPQFVLSQL